MCLYVLGENNLNVFHCPLLLPMHVTLSPVHAPVFVHNFIARDTLLLR